MRFVTEKVDVMPPVLESGIVYFSEEFEIAIHLCACECGAKITTPIGFTEWSITETPTGPTLYPSIGNWQLPCKSHYFIRQGEVVWAASWSHDQILAGREEEIRRRATYYESRQPQRSWISRLWNTIVHKVRGWLRR